LSGKVRVAIIGVGNCASSFIQGVHYYRNAAEDEFVPGLMHVNLGGYHISDIEFTAAFDIDKLKVGKDLSEAIFSSMNNTVKFTDVPPLGVKVERGMTHDGLGKYLSQVIEKAPGPTADIVSILKETRTDVVVSYLPVGSEMATKWYVEQILEAGCAFVNCIPVFIAREKYWQQRFIDRGLPVIGDDIKSQVGATIVHRVLTRLFRERGVKLERTSQLNVGGNTDFLNMLERERLESKKISKTNSVTSQLDYDMGKKNIHIGPSDYVEWLDDRKWAYIRMEGRTFGDVPLNIELKMEVVDSPNSAGIVIDAVRCAKLALDRGISGPLYAPASYFMKSPPEQYSDAEARAKTEAFIAGVNVPSASWEPTPGDAASADKADLSVAVHVSTETPPCDEPVPGDAASADAAED
jgi:myo-inositol-1-phosphate synthase